MLWELAQGDMKRLLSPKAQESPCVCCFPVLQQSSGKLALENHEIQCDAFRVTRQSYLMSSVKVADMHSHDKKIYIHEELQICVNLQRCLDC